VSGGATEVADSYGGAFDADRFRADGDQWPGGWLSFPLPWEPTERYARRGTFEEVGIAIPALPTSQRVVISVRDGDGWAAADVCQVLEITPTNQRVLLHRGRAAVRRALDPYLQTNDA
jgi:RNA polymerase sigma-70 factor, ECF subfamily